MPDKLWKIHLRGIEYFLHVQWHAKIFNILNEHGHIDVLVTKHMDKKEREENRNTCILKSAWSVADKAKFTHF